MYLLVFVCGIIELLILVIRDHHNSKIRTRKLKQKLHFNITKSQKYSLSEIFSNANESVIITIEYKQRCILIKLLSKNV